LSFTTAAGGDVDGGGGCGFEDVWRLRSAIKANCLGTTLENTKCIGIKTTPFVRKGFVSMVKCPL
jgi:hypothetical protein